MVEAQQRGGIEVIAVLEVLLMIPPSVRLLIEASLVSGSMTVVTFWMSSPLSDTARSLNSRCSREARRKLTRVASILSRVMITERKTKGESQKTAQKTFGLSRNHRR